MADRRDERFSIEGDPEDALRGLLAVDPAADKQRALDRLRQAYPEELATPGVERQMIEDALKAGATLSEAEESRDTHPRHRSD
jgi:hypothetical protein